MSLLWNCRILIALAAGGFFGTAFPGTAQAGFFDFLFGAFPSAEPARPPYDPNLGPWGSGSKRRADWGLHRPQKAHRKLVVAARTGHPVRPQGPTGLMEDDSLRKGDAVVTPEGIRIFTGYSGNHHMPDDFRMPSEVKGLSKDERKALAALDPHGSASDSKSGMVTGRSATELKVSVGETITDSKGRTIRYVGP